ncbi:phage adaptor protein [Reyranella sp.]|uniref:phage adaptor protein n=1 Tax=Reyranella sp. TaxID=1929291 RepID=UPI003BAA04FD
MPAQITTYAGLKAGVSAWLARSGDALLDSRFDDFLATCERRLYYGHATDDPGNPLRSEPLRIVEMETVDDGFVLQAEVAQPPDFLELISVQLAGPDLPLQIVSQRTLDGLGGSGGQGLGGVRLIAVSGTGFRVKDDPAGATAALRYYRRLATPAGAAANEILALYPDVYLYGCLVEAAIFTQDEAAAQRYLQLYNASVAGLNARTQRITASAAPVIRLRAGMLP